MKVLMELEPVLGLVEVLRRHLLSDLPPDKHYDRILLEEATILLNLILNSRIADYDEEYLQECDYLCEATQALESLEDCRAWRPFRHASIHYVEVRSSEGLVLIDFLGGQSGNEHLRLLNFRQHYHI